MSAYIHHVTLNTGHNRRSPRAEVSDATLALMSPWLQSMVETGARLPLPAASLSHYSATAMYLAGALVATIYAPRGPHTPGKPHDGDAEPMVTIGVAQRSRQGADLWGLMLATFGAAPGCQRPAEPWCAVALLPAMIAHGAAVVDLLGDLERCIAWAWITRQPDLRSADDDQS